MKLSSELFKHLTRSLGDGLPGEYEGEHRGDARLGLIGRGIIIPCPTRFGRKPVSVAVRDISATGIGVIHTHRLEPGEQFILRLPAANDRATSTGVLCTIAHCRPIGGVFAVGAHFAGVIDPTQPSSASRPAPLQVQAMASAFRRQAADGLSEEEAEQLREVEARLSTLQTQ